MKTTHQFARELLEMEDLPIVVPSLSDIENMMDPTVSEVTLENPVNEDQLGPAFLISGRIKPLDSL